MKTLILRLLYPKMYALCREYGMKKAFEEIGVYPDEMISQVRREQFGLIMQIRNLSEKEWVKDHFIKKMYKKTKRQFAENIKIVEPMRRAMVEKGLKEQANRLDLYKS